MGVSAERTIEGVILKLKRTPGLYLVGFMGTGKSTIGRALASELGWCFCDTDEEIERVAGRSIAEIFQNEGEEHFRDLETAEIRKQVRLIEKGNPCVVALGGGAYVQRSNYEIVQPNGITIWLDCGLDQICKRLDGDGVRPLALDPEKFRTLYEIRRPLYARADFRVSVEDRSVSETVRDVLQLPIF
jgi:shikimate kinase